MMRLHKVAYCWVGQREGLSEGVRFFKGGVVVAEGWPREEV